MELNIRNYHPSDLTTLYRICLWTGKSGNDASQLYEDPDLLGHFYLGPYALLEPDLCFVLTADKAPCGYIIGTYDSKEFYRKCEKEWFPILREKYKLPAEDDISKAASIIRLIHQGHKPKTELLEYPAHLHIDILPIAQGKGLGRKLIEIFINQLKRKNITALHFEVGKTNKNAIAFYSHIGFHIIKEYDFSIAFGMKF